MPPNARKMALMSAWTFLWSADPFAGALASKTSGSVGSRATGACRATRGPAPVVMWIWSLVGRAEGEVLPRGTGRQDHPVEEVRASLHVGEDPDHGVGVLTDEDRRLAVDPVDAEPFGGALPEEHDTVGASVVAGVERPTRHDPATDGLEQPGSAREDLRARLRSDRRVVDGYRGHLEVADPDGRDEPRVDHAVDLRDALGPVPGDGARSPFLPAGA